MWERKAFKRAVATTLLSDLPSAGEHSLSWQHIIYPGTELKLFHLPSSMLERPLRVVCITAGLGAGLALCVRVTPPMVPREAKIAGFFGFSSGKGVSSGAGMLASLCMPSPPMMSSSCRRGTTFSWARLACRITSHFKSVIFLGTWGRGLPQHQAVNTMYYLTDVRKKSTLCFKSLFLEEEEVYHSIKLLIQCTYYLSDVRQKYIVFQVASADRQHEVIQLVCKVHDILKALATGSVTSCKLSCPLSLRLLNS